jgi:hypothetical protein
MKLKTAKYILFSACVLMAILFLIGSAAKIHWFIFLGVALAWVGIAFWIVFGRCPNCGKFLGRTYGKHCPHCGEKIEWYIPCLTVTWRFLYRHSAAYRLSPWMQTAHPVVFSSNWVGGYFMERLLLFRSG